MNFKKHFKTKLFSFFYRNKRISPPQKDELKIWQGENSENIATQKIPKII
jgi:DNA replication protein DnaD